MFHDAKITLLMAVILSVVLNSQSVSASVAGGQVRFYGSIVEPSCLVKKDSQLLGLDCSNRNDIHSGIESEIANTHFIYIDTDEKLAVLTVTYR
ncbi:hypothetical protein [Cedecea sp.]|jgi:type 1 fimbria pilin|uniref:hypothetical protein n=1 Tax=Cedecea sp. TaxID=1970739 RepID=UPI002F40015D